MTNNCEFHVLLLIFWNMKFVTGYGWKQISWSNLTLQTIASYNVSSVVLVFSMLSLSRILISNLVVANLLMIMYSLPGMILLYLATTFFTPKVFLHEIHLYVHTYIHTYVHLYAVAWQQGVWLLYTHDPKGEQCPRESEDISVKS